MKTVQAFVVGAILKRVDAGKDLNGAQFAPYSTEYASRLRRGNEDDKVDLRMSSGLMNSIKGRDIIHEGDSVSVIFSPDTGTSPQKAFKVTELKQQKRDQLLKSERKNLPGKWVNTGKRGPEHNILADWLHYGTSKLPPRPFLGLTHDEIESLKQLLAKAKIIE